MFILAANIRFEPIVTPIPHPEIGFSLLLSLKPVGAAIIYLLREATFMSASGRDKGESVVLIQLVVCPGSELQVSLIESDIRESTVLGQELENQSQHGMCRVVERSQKPPSNYRIKCFSLLLLTTASEAIFWTLNGNDKMSPALAAHATNW
jgi:hypothetical protein